LIKADYLFWQKETPLQIVVMDEVMAQAAAVKGKAPRAAKVDCCQPMQCCHP